MSRIQVYKDTKEPPERGTPCVVNSHIKDFKILDGISQTFLENRRSGVEGVIWGAVPGYFGELFWVEHKDKTQAVYFIEELSDPVKPKKNRFTRMMKRR